MSKSLKTREPAGDVGIGISRWDIAPDAPMPCARCGARTMMSQIEPPTGGGRCHYLIRCRRCRHEFQAGPVFQASSGPIDLEEACRIARGAP